MQMDQDQEIALVEKLTEGRGGAFFYYSYDRCAHWRTLRSCWLRDAILQAFCH